MNAAIEIAGRIVLEVGVSEQIRTDPELHAAAIHATEYLKELLDAPNMKVDRRTLDWYASAEPARSVGASLSEWDRYGHRKAQIVVTRARMLDPVSRDISISQLLRQLLRQQFFQIGTVIDQGIQELEAEELRHGHAD